MQSLESLIDAAWERRADIGPAQVETGLRAAVDQALALLERGERRVAEPDGQGAGASTPGSRRRCCCLSA